MIVAFFWKIKKNARFQARLFFSIIYSLTKNQPRLLILFVLSNKNILIFEIFLDIKFVKGIKLNTGKKLRDYWQNCENLELSFF